MNCPVCDSKLREIDRYGVQVDICPDCKGIWLDRGELDKIIEMSAKENQTASQPRDYERDQYQPERRTNYNDDKDRNYERDNKNIDPKTGKPRRRESWLSELFDGFID